MKRISNILYWLKPEEKVIKLIEIILIMVIASLIYSTTSRAVNIVHFSSNSVDASFFTVDPSPCDCSVIPTPKCIFTDVFVSASDNTIQTPPGKGGVSQILADFEIIQFDCAIQLLSANCQLANPDFQVGKKLDSATLNATLECFDFVSNSTFNVSASLTWTATGDRVRQSSSNRLQFPGPSCNIHSNSDGSSRGAQASGTVSVGTTNFTPNPTDFADISSGKSGEVEAGCQP